MSARLSARLSVRLFARSSVRSPGRLSARRTVVAATAVAGAAVCGTLLAPAAYADGGAPGAKGLTITVADRTHEPLTRGSGTETFTLTVSNPAATAQDYTGLMFGEAGGPSPILGKQLHLDVTPVSAPATDLTLGQQDQAAMAMWQPKGTRLGTAFAVPAHGSYSWKVTFGFQADFPSNNDALNLDIDSATSPQQVHFDLSPALKDGKLTGTWGPKATVRPGAPGRTWYELQDTAGGAFDQPLRTLVFASGAKERGMTLEVLAGGRWVPAQPAGQDQWWLPQVPKGFAGGHTHRYDLRFSVPNGKGTHAAGALDLTVRTNLAAGNDAPIVDLDVKGGLRYNPTPAASAPGTPTAEPSSTPTAAVPAASTAPAGTAPVTDAAQPTAQLAHTGSSHAGLFAGLAALFAAAGAALIAAVARKRRTHGAG